MEANKPRRLLEAHPRAAGALFTVSLLLTQAAPVLAGGGAKVGP